MKRNESPSILDHKTAREIIKSSMDYPVDRCLINTDWKKTGLARIIVIRRHENERFIIGVYLVDIFCLGLKNAFCNAGLNEKTIKETLIPRCFMGDSFEEIDLGYVKEIIFGAIAYAQELGFDPHPDSKLARKVLGVAEIANQHGIRFGGPDGKPLFIAGPDDDARAIMRKLADRLGKDGFQFIIRSPDEIFSGGRTIDI